MELVFSEPALVQGGKQHLSTTKYQFTPSHLLVLVAKFTRMWTKVQTRGVHEQPGPCPNRQDGQQAGGGHHVK